MCEEGAGRKRGKGRRSREERAPSKLALDLYCNSWCEISWRARPRICAVGGVSSPDLNSPGPAQLPRPARLRQCLETGTHLAPTIPKRFRTRVRSWRGNSGSARREGGRGPCRVVPAGGAAPIDLLGFSRYSSLSSLTTAYSQVGGDGRGQEALSSILLSSSRFHLDLPLQSSRVNSACSGRTCSAGGLSPHAIRCPS